MTINSNKMEKTIWFKGIRTWFKDIWSNYGLFPYIFILVLGLMLLLVWYEEAEKIELQKNKIELIKTVHPTLIFGGSVFYDEIIITDYKLVKMDDTYKIDIMQDGVHSEYMNLSSVKAIEEIK